MNTNEFNNSNHINNIHNINDIHSRINNPIPAYEHYYVPAHSHWPVLGSIALGCIALGIVNLLHHHTAGWYLLSIGTLLISWMIIGWFKDVIKESLAGLYSRQMDHSFRWGMGWFIFSEVMFFSCFFGVLFYARHFSIPWLGGLGAKAATHTYLWPHFSAQWPLLTNPNPTLFPAPSGVMDTWGLPAINTLILLSSGATITWAHWGLLKNKNIQLAIGLTLTIILGISFLTLQAFEYHEAYTHLNLKLSSGIYGSTFFMLTGFHGLHVSLGTLMLIVILARCLKGHFTPKHHFAFEGVAWYWHFVDVVWLFLFIFVYWL